MLYIEKKKDVTHFSGIVTNKYKSKKINWITFVDIAGPFKSFSKFKIWVDQIMRVKKTSTFFFTMFPSGAPYSVYTLLKEGVKVFPTS